jgi:hypothetical protein
LVERCDLHLSATELHGRGRKEKGSHQDTEPPYAGGGGLAREHSLNIVFPRDLVGLVILLSIGLPSYVQANWGAEPGDQLQY